MAIAKGRVDAPFAATHRPVYAQILSSKRYAFHGHVKRFTGYPNAKAIS